MYYSKILLLAICSIVHFQMEFWRTYLLTLPYFIVPSLELPDWNVVIYSGVFKQGMNAILGPTGGGKSS